MNTSKSTAIIPHDRSDELYVALVSGGLDGRLLLGRDAVNDESAVHVHPERGRLGFLELQLHRHGDVHVERHVAFLLALLERALQAGPEPVPALHGDLHDRDVLGALDEGGELAGAQRRASVGDDGAGAVGVYDADHLVGVLGAHAGDELGVERQVGGAELELRDGHVVHGVGRRLGLVGEVEVGDGAGQRQDDEEEEAAAPEQAAAAASALVLVLGVAGDAALPHGLSISKLGTHAGTHASLGSIGNDGVPLRPAAARASSETPASRVRRQGPGRGGFG